MHRILLMTLSGPDQIGLTATFTGILSRHAAHVLDIGQAVIQSHLNLGLLLQLADDAEEPALRRTVKRAASARGLRADFTAIDEADYESWVTRHGQPRFIATLLGRKLSATNLAHIAGVVARYGLNIDSITRLTGRFSLREDQPHERACVEFSIRGQVEDLEGLRNDLLAITRDNEVDVAFQEDNLFRRNRRLIVFDMDSTLIQCEVMDELAKRAGVGEQVAMITEAAMRGDIDFDQSFRLRLATLKGLDAAVLTEIADTLPITEGAERLISTLKTLGYKVGILSGGFRYFADRLQARFGLDCVSANELDTVDGRLTGQVRGEIVNGEKKAELLRNMAAQLGISMEQTIAVGDGANDLPMLRIAGLGVAFHAKPVVRENARHTLSTLGLDGILYLLGLHDRELQA